MVRGLDVQGISSMQANAMALLLCFLVYTGPGRAPGEALRVEAVLAKVRSALAMADFPAKHAGLRAVGTIMQYGAEAEFELILDDQGRFRTISTGALGEARAFDGRDAWA